MLFDYLLFLCAILGMAAAGTGGQITCVQMLEALYAGEKGALLSLAIASGITNSTYRRRLSEQEKSSAVRTLNAGMNIDARGMAGGT